jgi:8-amino-7-oxononanoate synthase
MKSLLEQVAADPRVAEAALAEKIRRYPFFHVVESASLPEITIGGRKMVNLGSNNYLGLAAEEGAIAAAVEATQRWGAGVTGSRLLNGTLPLHGELERKIADFYQKEAALVFPTGYAANLGTISGLVDRQHRVLADHDVHASVLDGIVFSRARFSRFRHNDIDDATDKLSRADYDLCVVDGVYSMAGDVAPLARLVELTESRGVTLLVDEAHGLGTLGPRGAGAAEAAAVLSRVDVLTVTFSKSLGSCGGAVVASRAVIDALRIRTRPFIFTASNTPGSLGAALYSLDRLTREPAMVAVVADRARYLRDRLSAEGFSVRPSETPIVTIEVGSDFRTSQAWRMLFNRGVFCNPVIRPAVTRGHGLLRLSVMRTHDEDLLDRAVDAFVDVLALVRGAETSMAGLETAQSVRA